MDIKELRNEIDNIDKELVSLLERRMQVVKNVAIFKKENNVPVLDSSREGEVLSKNVALIKDKELKVCIEEILKSIMDVSKNLQKTII